MLTSDDVRRARSVGSVLAGAVRELRRAGALVGSWPGREAHTDRLEALADEILSVRDALHRDPAKDAGKAEAKGKGKAAGKKAGS